MAKGKKKQDSGNLGKPTGVTGPKRTDQDTYQVEWKQASNYKDTKVGWDKVYLVVRGDKIVGKKKKWVPLLKKKKKNPGFEVKRSTTSYTFKINRKKWYPNKKKPKMDMMSFYVQVKGKNGKTVKSSTSKLDFQKPKPPKCEFDFDDETGLLTINVTAEKDDIKDCYDCYYKVMRKDVKTESSRYNGKARIALNTNGKELKGSNKNAEFTLYTNVEQLRLIKGSSITFTVTLISRGFSGATKKTFKFYIKPPDPPKITKIDLSNKDITSLAKNLVTPAFASGFVRVFYTSSNKATADYDEKAVTDYTLQRLVTPYDVDKPVEAALQGGWDNVDTNMGSTSDQPKKTKKKKEDDGVMGESMIEVLTAMGFNNNAHVYDKRVWYRVMVVRQGMTDYSVPKEAEELACPIPTAKNDKSGFMSLKNSVLEPGTSIDGVVGWSNANDPNEGVDNPNWADAIWTTIVEWSEHEKAVHSNQQPSVLEIDWEYSADKHQTVYDNYAERVARGDFGEPTDFVPWQKSASFSIYGLTPGNKYYLWTRRHMVLGEYDDYGPRTQAPIFPFIPIDNPTTVQVYTDERYVFGYDMTVSWSHDAKSDQTSWNIYIMPNENRTLIEGDTIVTDIPKKLIAAGTGKMNSYKISGEAIERAIKNGQCVVNSTEAFEVNRKISIAVGVSTGGKEILSCSDIKGRFIGYNTMEIGYIPSGTMALMNNVNHTAYLFSRTKDVLGVVNVFAKYDTWYDLPDGEHLQPAGECVFTTTLDADNFTSTTSLNSAERNKFASYVSGSNAYAYVAKVNTYTHRSMFDGSVYIVQGYLRDPMEESLVSTEKRLEFTHTPSRKAQVCGKSSIIQGMKIPLQQALLSNSKVSPGSGIRDGDMPASPGVEIVIDKPATYVSTDRFDLYRITPDGGTRIQQDCQFGTKIIDKFAPFSNDAILRYGIVTITAEGSMTWKEVKYSLKYNCGMRFDWGSADNMRSLELPFNVELKDSFSKDVRIEGYLDGSVAAHFNEAVTRKATNKAKIVRYDPNGIHTNPLKFEMIRELAQHTGPVFFRAHNGVAYECVVEVDGIEENYDKLESDISFKLTEINPPSAAFAPTNNMRNITTFSLPPLSRPTSTLTRSKLKNVPAKTDPVITRTNVKDRLYYDEVGKDKRGNAISTTSKLTSGGNEVMYIHFVKADKDVYEIRIPYMTIDMQTTNKQDAAKGIFSFKQGKKTITIRNNYGVWVYYDIRNGSNVIFSGYKKYGTMDGKLYNQQLSNVGMGFTVKRGKTDSNVTISAKTYLIKSETEVAGTVKAKSGSSFTLDYTVDPDASSNSPDTIQMSFGKLIGKLTSTSTTPYYRIYVSSKSYAHKKFSTCKKYYDSGEIKIEKVKKSFTVNVPGSAKMTRKANGDSTVYLTLVVNLRDKNGNSTREIYESVEVTIPSLDTVSDIHTNLSSPKVTTVQIKRK